MLGLVERDRSDYGAVYEREHASLLRLAWLLCRDPRQSEDAVAAAFARTLPAWRAGRVDDAGAYLRTALLNELRSRHRRSLTAARHQGQISGAAPSAFEGRSDLHLAVLAELARLPDRQRAAVVLRFYEDRSLADVAAILGCPTGTAKSLVSRALTALRPSLEDLRHDR
jgi:RNA polymerase sigma factor (sigma-70 family)